MRTAAGLIAGMLSVGAAHGSPLQVVASAQCVFDQRCSLDGSACYDWHTDVAMSAWKLPTRLMSSDRDAPPLSYGFETIGGYTEFELDGRKLKGDVSFDVGERRIGPVWDYELPKASLFYRARNASFDAWHMYISADGAAHLTITQNNSSDRARHLGHCNVTWPDLETAWNNSLSEN